MRSDFATQARSLLIAFGAIGGTSVVFYLLATLGGADQGFHVGLFSNILFVGGYIVSSVAFADLHDPRAAVHYVMLPGSTYEKYIARLLLTSIGWVVAVIVLYTASTVLGLAIASIFRVSGPGVFLPTGRTLWIAIATYLVTQPVFLFGSIYFRKIALLKTALAGFVVVMSLAIVATLASRIAFSDVFARWKEIGDVTFGPGDVTLNPNADAFFETLRRIGQICTWVVTPVLFWTLGVLRLRETEV